MDGLKFVSAEPFYDMQNAYQMTLPNGFELVAAADLQADRMPDLVLFNASTRNVVVRYLKRVSIGFDFVGTAYLMQGSVKASVPAGWQVNSMGDFNGDKKPDVLLFNPTTFQTLIWYLDGNKVTGQAAGPTLSNQWLMGGAGDYNNDGKADLMMYDPATRQCGVWYLNGVTYAGGKFFTDAANNKILLPAGFNLITP
jgi:hypothetical protein